MGLGLFNKQFISSDVAKTGEYEVKLLSCSNDLLSIKFGYIIAIIAASI
jgi:hypothetical protein